MTARRRAVRLLALAGTPGATLTTATGAVSRDSSRDTLATDDGRAAAGGGTTGGSTADDAPVVTVRTRSEPVRAPHGGSAAFPTPGHVETADLVKSRNGTAPHRTGTRFDGCPVDLPAIHDAHDSASERDLPADVGWTPTLHQKIDSAGRADREVAHGAGAGRTTR